MLSLVAMKDSEMTLGQLRAVVAEFIQERGWQSKQDPKSVAGSVVIEAAELYENFQWANDPYEVAERVKNSGFRGRMMEEVGDILFYLADFANQCGFELSEAFVNKLSKTRAKYPSSVGLDHEKYHKIKQEYRDNRE